MENSTWQIVPKILYSPNRTNRSNRQASGVTKTQTPKTQTSDPENSDPENSDPEKADPENSDPLKFKLFSIIFTEIDGHLMFIGKSHYRATYLCFGLIAVASTKQ